MSGGYRSNPRSSLLYREKWSGRADSNRRPLDPQSSALTRLRYAPDRQSHRGYRPKGSRNVVVSVLIATAKGSGATFDFTLTNLPPQERFPRESAGKGGDAAAGRTRFAENDIDFRFQ